MEVYQEVYLLSDLPAKQLHRGDVAVLVEVVPHPKGGEQGAVLEIFNALGESVDVVTVPLSLVAPLCADQVPTVRPVLAVA